MHRQTLLARAAGALGIAALAACSDAPTAAPLASRVPASAPAAAKGGPNALPTNAGRLYVASDMTGNLELYSMNPDGSDRRRLTFTPESEYYVAVSRDGKKLAFTVGASKDGSMTDIYTMNVDGSGRRRVTTLDGLLVGAADWSPDGRTIAFHRAVQGEQTVSLWKVSTNGGGLTRLSAPGIAAGDPTWSPDGARIVYVGNDPAASTSQNLFIMNADGSGTQLLFDCGDIACRSPTFAPDGRRLVYSRGTLTMNICDMTLPTPLCNMVLPGTFAGSFAVFSPDGTRLAYAGATAAGDQVVTVDANGANQTPVTDNMVGIYGMAWGR